MYVLIFSREKIDSPLSPQVIWPGLMTAHISNGIGSAKRKYIHCMKTNEIQSNLVYLRTLGSETNLRLKRFSVCPIRFCKNIYRDWGFYHNVGWGNSSVYMCSIKQKFTVTKYSFATLAFVPSNAHFTPVILLNMSVGFACEIYPRATLAYLVLCERYYISSHKNMMRVDSFCHFSM